jgi:hypothetical protein
MLGACGEKPGTEACSPVITPSGKPVKHPHPRRPLSCGIGLQSSNYCTYDAEGRLKGVEQEASGVCITISTH